MRIFFNAHERIIRNLLAVNFKLVSALTHCHKI